jgi:hypothetical protein
VNLPADEASETDQRLFNVAEFLAGMPIKPGQEKAGGVQKRNTRLIIRCTDEA